MCASRSVYPPGATNANWFGLFNAVSWQIMLGTPTVLYARSQGAGATVLGLIASFTPLLVVFQIPAAHLLPRYGYRRFILAGWGTRSFFIFAMAGVPLLTGLPPWARLSLVILCMFAFNLIRGIASGAWLPWMSELIPHEVRGRFLSRDMVFSQVGSLIALSVSAAVLRGNVQPWQFSAVFLLSAVSATVSLWYLNRIPDVTAPDRLRRSGQRVPWKHMLMYAPFLRLVIFNVLWVAVVGGLGVFTVAYLRGVQGYSESLILRFSAAGIIGGLATAPWIGRLLDREGSRPVMKLSLAVFLLILLVWWLVAASVVAATVTIIAAVHLVSGVAGTAFAVANSRLMMAIMPVMGRNHFFALFTVITSIALGASPIGWGVFLDAMRGFQRTTGFAAWNNYSIYFALVWMLCAATLAYASYLHEPPPPADEPPAARSPVPAPSGIHEGTA